MGALRDVGDRATICRPLHMDPVTTLATAMLRICGPDRISTGIEVDLHHFPVSLMGAKTKVSLGVVVVEKPVLNNEFSRRGLEKARIRLICIRSDSMQSLRIFRVAVRLVDVIGCLRRSATRIGGAEKAQRERWFGIAWI